MCRYMKIMPKASTFIDITNPRGKLSRKLFMYLYLHLAMALRARGTCVPYRYICTDVLILT